QRHQRVRLALLICFNIILCCATLVVVARYDSVLGLDPGLKQTSTYTFYPPAFHVFFDPARLLIAVLVVTAFAGVASLFVIARFSFGYLAGFYFYITILGYLWINCFSDLNYNHRLAGLSAVASIIAFLLPALFISSPLRQKFMLSAQAFDWVLM